MPSSERSPVACSTSLTPFVPTSATPNDDRSHAQVFTRNRIHSHDAAPFTTMRLLQSAQGYSNAALRHLTAFLIYYDFMSIPDPSAGCTLLFSACCWSFKDGLFVKFKSGEHRHAPFLVRRVAPVRSEPEARERGTRPTPSRPLRTTVPKAVARWRSSAPCAREH